jgi:hypothetical protein
MASKRARRKEPAAPPAPPPDDDDSDDEDDNDDDDDLSGSSDDSGEPDHPVGKAFHKVVEDLKAEGLTYIMLDEPAVLEEEAAKEGAPDLSRITRAAVLATDHLLLRSAVGEIAIGQVKQMRRVRRRWPYGDTSLNNTLLLEHMMPAVTRAKTAIASAKWDLATSQLLAVLLCACEYDYWINDNEVYMEETKFKNFFKHFAKGWRDLLARSDDEIGIVNCRPALRRLLKRFEEDLRTSLEAYEFVGQVKLC